MGQYSEKFTEQKAREGFAKEKSLGKLHQCNYLPILFNRVEIDDTSFDYDLVEFVEDFGPFKKGDFFEQVSFDGKTVEAHKYGYEYRDEPNIVCDVKIVPGLYYSEDLQQTDFAYDLKDCKMTPKGLFILPDGFHSFKQYKCSLTGRTLGSVGRHILSGELHGSYNRRDSEIWQGEDYLPVWRALKGL